MWKPEKLDTTGGNKQGKSAGENPEEGGYVD